MSRKVARKVKLNPKAPIVIVFFMILIVIGIIVTMFLVFINDDLKGIKALDGKNTNLNATSNQTSSGGTSSGSGAVSSSGEPVSSAPPPASADTSSVPVDSFDPLSTVVGETAAVEKSYFDDAVFIGDSISKGLKLNGVLPPANVIADQNVGIDQIANDKPIYLDVSGTKRTLFQMLDALPIKPKKVYIMLGSNGLPHYTNDVHMNFYNIVLDRIIKKYPDATIYVQSVTPITKEAEESYAKRKKDFTNKKINEFNELVKAACKDKNIYYLSVRDALVDENGYLSSTHNAGDGVHFKKSGHEAMYQYYKTHTVPDVVNQQPDDVAGTE